MAILDDTDLQTLADLGADLALKDDCEILSDVEGALDSIGGALHTYPVQSTVKGMVVDWRPPSQDYMIANQIVGEVVKKAFLPLGTTVLKKNRLRMRGITYKIVEPIPVSSYSVFTEVIVVVTTLGV